MTIVAGSFNLLLMNKSVSSRDPRKPAIVAALKEASNCRKVTNVAQVGPDHFQGNCMWPNEGKSIEGTVTVTWSPILGSPLNLQSVYEDAMNH